VSKSGHFRHESVIRLNRRSRSLTTPAATAVDTTTLRDPAEFEDVVATGEAMMVDVHVPDEGHIQRRNASIPLDEVS
jgi:hypothetical protein